MKPLAIGVCSWSLQVKSIPELKGFLDRLGINVVQIACGDPHHAAWDEGDDMPEGGEGGRLPHDRRHARLPRRGLHHARRPSRRPAASATRPPRPERLERFKWALDRTRDLGLTDLMLHAGFLPEPGDPDRKPFLDTLGKVSAAGRRRRASPSPSRRARRRPTCCGGRSTT